MLASQLSKTLMCWKPVRERCLSSDPAWSWCVRRLGKNVTQRWVVMVVMVIGHGWVITSHKKSYNVWIRNPPVNEWPVYVFIGFMWLEPYNELNYDQLSFITHENHRANHLTCDQKSLFMSSHTLFFIHVLFSVMVWARHDTVPAWHCQRPWTLAASPG